MSSDAKTKATAASVEDHLASRASASQRIDCAALMAMLERVTLAEPKMWGPSIVGYGSYTYTYDSGRTGEACLAGFAIRGRDLVIYLSASCADQEALLGRLGKHSMGKSCLYVRRLGDVDLAVLEQLVVGSVREINSRYGGLANR